MWWIGITVGVVLGVVGVRRLSKGVKRFDLGGVSEHWLAQARAIGGEDRER
jgi:hypothetical protein